MPSNKVKLSDVTRALDAIGEWTAAVKAELEGYIQQKGDIDLATNKADVGTDNPTQAILLEAGGVGRRC